MSEFSHFDKEGNAIMSDVSGKEATERRAVAEGFIKMSPECYAAVRGQNSEGSVCGLRLAERRGLGHSLIVKGDVLAVARIAGISAVKQTSSLIPLCHNIFISKAAVDFVFDDDSCEIKAVCTVKTTGVTGVEMEALTGVSVALLTIYDMCKSIDRSMEIGGIRLLEKTGGKSGAYHA